MWTLTYFLTFRSYPIEQRSMGFVLRAAAAVATAATAAADAVVIRAAAATEAIRAVAAQGLGHFLVPVGADVQGVAAVHVADGETTDERLRQFISQYELWIPRVSNGEGYDMSSSSFQSGGNRRDSPVKSRD